MQRRPLLWRRRTLLGAMAASVPAAALAQPALPSLKAAAAAAGLGFGTDSDVRITEAMPGYAALIVQQCDLLAGNMSWSVTAGPQGAREPVREDPNVAFARAHGLRLTGMHLLWFKRVPPWFADLSPAAAQAAVNQHIAQLAGHYAGQVYSWNVLNEAIDTREGDANGLRRSVLTSKLGPNYAAEAFHAARAADPRALLLYNDYALEMATPTHAARRDALMRLLDGLQRAGAPIDGVGLQSHFVLDDAVFDAAVYQRLLHDIASRGLKIVLTELDVLDKRGGSGIAARDADVAARYTAVLDVALAQPAVKAVVLWGLCDRYTWLVASNQANLGRPDGLPTRPLAFDDALAPKPAFFAILNALKRAPMRPA